MKTGLIDGLAKGSRAGLEWDNARCMKVITSVLTHRVSMKRQRNKKKAFKRRHREKKKKVCGNK